MRILIFLLVAVSVAAYRAAAPAPSQTIAAKNTSDDILFQSDDQGNTWQSFRRGLPESEHISSVSAYDGALFLGLDDGAVCSSAQPGMGVWEKESAADALMQMNESFLTNNLANTKGVSGIFSGKSGLYICMLGGGFFRKTPGVPVWEPMHEAMKHVVPRVVFEHSDGSVFVAYASEVFKSADNGKTWLKVLDKGVISSFASTGETLFAGGNLGVLRSSDGGAHWEYVLSDANASYRVVSLGDRVMAIPSADVRSSYMNGFSLRISADQGQSWQHIGGSSSLSGEIYSLVPVGEYLFCSHPRGISRSSNGGKSWDLVYSFTPGSPNEFLRLAVSGQKIFAVKLRSGC